MHLTILSIFRVVSGLPGALYSICCLGVSTILESEKIVTRWPKNDLIALTLKGSRGVGGAAPIILQAKRLDLVLRHRSCALGDCTLPGTTAFDLVCRVCFLQNYFLTCFIWWIHVT